MNKINARHKALAIASKALEQAKIDLHRARYPAVYTAHYDKTLEEREARYNKWYAIYWHFRYKTDVPPAYESYQ